MHIFIREFIKYIKLERHYSFRTVEAYQSDLMQFEYFLQEYYRSDSVNWKLVNRQIIRAYLGWLAASGVKKISASRKLASLKSFFSFLTKQKSLTINPALTLKTPKFAKYLPEFISMENINNLMELTPVDTFEGIRDRAILELFYASGIRRAELIDLKMSNLLLDESLIRVFGKGGKERVIPIGSHAVKFIKSYLDFRNKHASIDVDNVFILKSGKKIYPMSVQRIINKYLGKYSEIKKKSPHVLRHTFATHMMNQGADIRAVKDLLGHANLSTTQIYTHTSIDHLKSIYHRAHPGITQIPKLKKEFLMNISITARGYKAPERLKQYITSKVEKKTRIYEGVIDMEVILSYEKQTQVAEFKFKLNNKTIIAREKSDDIFKSIDLAVDNIERQIIKLRDKLRSHNNKKIGDNLSV